MNRVSGRARTQPMRIAMMPLGAVGGAAVTDPLSVPIGGVKARAGAVRPDSAWAGPAEKATASAAVVRVIGSLMTPRTPVSEPYSRQRGVDSATKGVCPVDPVPRSIDRHEPLDTTRGRS